MMSDRLWTERSAPPLRWQSAPVNSQNISNDVLQSQQFLPRKVTWKLNTTYEPPQKAYNNHI